MEKPIYNDMVFLFIRFVVKKSALLKLADIFAIHFAKCYRGILKYSKTCCSILHKSKWTHFKYKLGCQDVIQFEVEASTF